MKTIQQTIPNPIHDFSFPHPQHEALFFDIETTGLSPKAASIYLIGVAYYSAKTDQWKLIQWFADDYHSESEILSHFFQQLEQFNYLYHFNGKTFDIPFLLAKAQKHQLSLSPHCHLLLGMDGDFTHSIDILAKIRPFKKTLGLEKANQTALEQWIGIQRKDQYDGGKLIPIYSQYMQSKVLHPEEAQEYLNLLLLHNHDDMLGMLEVVSILSYQQLFTSFPALATDCQITNDSHWLKLNITLAHSVSLPKSLQIKKEIPISKCSDFYSKHQELPLNNHMVFSIENHMITLEIPMLKDTLLYFFSNYKEYYYLPLEDTAIHQSVAEFVEPSHRKKATKATAYIKKEGCFLPSLSICSLPDSFQGTHPVFHCIYKDRICFYEYTNDPDFLIAYAALQIQSLYKSM